MYVKTDLTSGSRGPQHSKTRGRVSFPELYTYQETFFYRMVYSPFGDIRLSRQILKKKRIQWVKKVLSRHNEIPCQSFSVENCSLVGARDACHISRWLMAVSNSTSSVNSGI